MAPVLRYTIGWMRYTIGWISESSYLTFQEWSGGRPDLRMARYWPVCAPGSGEVSAARASCDLRV
jgi:hypothetical protein